MNLCKLFINILIILSISLILWNLMYSIKEGYSDGCKFLSREVKEESEDSAERRQLNRLNKLQRDVDLLVYPLKFSMQNEKELEKIGPMQQSISDSQSGDVTGDTKLTGL